MTYRSAKSPPQPSMLYSSVVERLGGVVRRTAWQVDDMKIFCSERVGDGDRNFAKMTH